MSSESCFVTFNVSDDQRGFKFSLGSRRILKLFLLLFKSYKKNSAFLGHVFHSTVTVCCLRSDLFLPVQLVMKTRHVSGAGVHCAQQLVEETQKHRDRNVRSSATCPTLYSTHNCHPKQRNDENGLLVLLVLSH